MKALILAAGEGQRLRPLTSDRPKCLVELFGRPLLAWQLEALAACGITDVALAAGHAAAALAPYGLPMFQNDRYRETNMVESLFAAWPFAAGGSDVLVVYGDIVTEPRIIAAVAASTAPVAVAVDEGWQALWSLRFGNPLTDAETLRLGPEDRIIDVGKRPRSLAEIEGQYMGLFKISAAAVPVVKAFYDRLDRGALYDGQPFERMYMTSFLQAIAEHLMPVRAVRVRHGWLELDRLEDVACYEPARLERDGLFRLSAWAAGNTA